MKSSSLTGFEMKSAMPPSGNVLCSRQLAAAIDGDRDYRRCEACKKWFEVSAENRIDAKFCQQSCRFRAYRQRQQRARELAAQGMPPHEIAALVDSDVKTVKGWLKKK
jgi:hypothetical protein